MARAIQWRVDGKNLGERLGVPPSEEAFVDVTYIPEYLTAGEHVIECWLYERTKGGRWTKIAEAVPYTIRVTINVEVLA